MSTVTQTYTRTDICKVFENFQADLEMLALRTQAMESGHARKYAQDVCLMAQERCLESVHIQLRDSNGRLVKAHRYSVEEGTLSSSQRPGKNRWPCLPGGSLGVIVKYSDRQQAEQLKKSGKLLLCWSPSGLSTNYYGMQKDGDRSYSSNSYGLRRDTFTN